MNASNHRAHQTGEGWTVRRVQGTGREEETMKRNRNKPARMVFVLKLNRDRSLAVKGMQTNIKMFATFSNQAMVSLSHPYTLMNVLPDESKRKAVGCTERAIEIPRQALQNGHQRKAEQYDPSLWIGLFVCFDQPCVLNERGHRDN